MESSCQSGDENSPGADPDKEYPDSPGCIIGLGPACGGGGPTCPRVGGPGCPPGCPPGTGGGLSNPDK